MVALQAWRGQPTIGALFVLLLLIADIMENLILENGCIYLVNENGDKQIISTVGYLVGTLFETANNHEKDGKTRIAEELRSRARRVMDTPQYHDWALSL